MNRKILAALLLAPVALLAAGCQRSSLPGADNNAPYSSSPWASCPKGDAGRVKDATLLPPDYWVCIR